MTTFTVLHALPSGNKRGFFGTTMDIVGPAPEKMRDVTSKLTMRIAEMGDLFSRTDVTVPVPFTATTIYSSTCSFDKGYLWSCFNFDNSAREDGYAWVNYVNATAAREQAFESVILYANEDCYQADSNEFCSTKIEDQIDDEDRDWYAVDCKSNTQEMQEGRDIWHPASAEYTAYPSRSIAVIGPLLDTGVAYPAEKPWDETATTCRSIEDICGGDQCSIDVSGAGDLKDALYKCF